MYETFAHTADLGLRVQAPTLAELFADAARGLTSILVVNLDAVRPVEEVRIVLQSDAHGYLLFDWLSELLFQFEKRHLLFSEFDVQAIDDRHLVATCRGETMDPARHQMDHEVKAITYHQLVVEQRNGQWVAEVIVDI